MTKAEDCLGGGEIEPLILRALVRKLIAKGLLSEDSVRALLLDAAMSLEVDGGSLTTGAAHDLVERELAPAFLGQ